MLRGFRKEMIDLFFSAVLGFLPFVVLKEASFSDTDFVSFSCSVSKKGRKNPVR